MVVGAAIVDDLEVPTRLLAARRTEPPALAGGWGLPGGKVGPGEEPPEALDREVREELGVAIRVGSELTRGDSGGAWPLGEGYALRVWFARVVTGEPQPLEDHDQLRVLRRDDLYAVSWLPADLPIISAIHARLS